MPFYELLLILRPQPKKDLVECLKRTANLVWKENGALKKIEYLGHSKLPYRCRRKNSDEIFNEGNYFLYQVSLNSSKLPIIRPELSLDLDIIKSTWNQIGVDDIPEDYQCTLEEELLIPSFRPSVQPLLRYTNVKAGNRNMIGKRNLHTDTQPERTVCGPGLMSIFEQNPKRLHRIQFLDQLFKNQGHEIRIAGGAVRDILLGQEPQDIDFATTSRPEESLDLLKNHEDMFRIIVTDAGQRHGTVAVKFKGHDDVNFDRLSRGKDSTLNPIDSKQTAEPEYDEESPFEITTLRRDNLTDGRHAEVEFINDWKLDAERRDLTINAMFLTIDNGELVDYFSGESDLRNGVIRFVGNADMRIKEDYLRILRFFRFWSRYGRANKPDKDTITTISDNLNGLGCISGERIWVELKKIFALHPCVDAVDLMLQIRLFDHIEVVDKGKNIDTVRVIHDLIEVQSNVLKYNRDILRPRMVSAPDNINDKKMKDLLAAINFATVLETKDMCLSAHKRLKFSNLERDTLMYILENRNKKTELNMQHLKQQLVAAAPSERSIVRQRMIAFLIYMGRMDLIEQFEKWEVPHFPISGHEVAREVSKRKIPGHRIKNILQTLSDEWSLSDFKATKEELLQTMERELESFSKSTNDSIK